GKTGTAQVKSIAQGKSYNAAALAVQHRDHAWFISFAPVDKPKIAIAVILENGGWGATAAPVARQLTDFYLLKILGQGSSNELSTPQGMTVLADETLISESSKTSLASLQAAFAAARQAPQAASGVKP
ncbi:MAG TPA: penicillin-binding transpeptidase domain-containing protein, partial [Vitreoscilla sp.]|nr:penicillin-binding transpeptidase domain-containing protein [Vitreoscilla sp.]